MRIALPLLDGKVSLQYDSCQALGVADIDLDEVTASALTVHELPVGEVSTSPAWITGLGVEVLLVGTIDSTPARGLMERGIQVLSGVQDEDPAMVVSQFLEGVSAAIQAQGHHGCCGGGHCGGEEDRHNHAAPHEDGCCGAHTSHAEEGCCGGHDHHRA